MIDTLSIPAQRYNDIAVFQQVLVHHRWMLNLPSLYRFKEFNWRHLEDLVIRKENVTDSLLAIHKHFTPKPEYYAPYVVYALEAQLEVAARIEWYQSKEHVLRRLILAVPTDVAEQEALMDYIQNGTPHPIIGAMEATDRHKLDQIDLMKEAALKRWV